MCGTGAWDFVCSWVHFLFHKSSVFQKNQPITRMGIMCWLYMLYIRIVYGNTRKRVRFTWTEEAGRCTYCGSGITYQLRAICEKSMQSRAPEGAQNLELFRIWVQSCNSCTSYQIIANYLTLSINLRGIGMFWPPSPVLTPGPQKKDFDRFRSALRLFAWGLIFTRVFDFQLFAKKDAMGTRITPHCPFQRGFSAQSLPHILKNLPH